MKLVYQIKVESLGESVDDMVVHSEETSAQEAIDYKKVLEVIYPKDKYNLFVLVKEVEGE